MADERYPISDEGYFHLTENGWLRQDMEPFPTTRLETWHYETTTPSSAHKELVHLTRIWIAPGPEAEIAAIRHRYGDAVEPSPNRHIVLDCRSTVAMPRKGLAR